MNDFQLIDICQRIIFAIQKFEKILKKDLAGPIDLVESSRDIESMEFDINNLKKALENIESKKSLTCDDILKSIVVFHVGLVRISVMVRDVHNIVSLASRMIIEEEDKPAPLNHKNKRSRKNR